MEIDVAVGLVEGDNSFYLKLDADNGGQPGAVLLSVTNLSSSTLFGTCCGLVSSGMLSSGVTLNTGTNYWLVIGPTDTTSTTWEAWNFSNYATGNDDYSTDGGLTWGQNGNQPQGAFQILRGSCCGTTPEPTSLLLFSTGCAAALGCSVAEGNSDRVRTSSHRSSAPGLWRRHCACSAAAIGIGADRLHLRQYQATRLSRPPAAHVTDKPPAAGVKFLVGAEREDFAALPARSFE